jgi:hypothetical protein
MRARDPGPQQQVLVAVRERQEARDRAVLVSCPVHPARRRQDREIALDAMCVLARVERGRGKFCIIRQGIADKGAMARTAGLSELARKSHAAPTYEMPVAPIRPSDQGCVTTHSAIRA